MTKRFVYAQLLGPDVCYVAGHSVQDRNAPVLAACRYLVDLGYDRERTLLAFRGPELAMKVKIGEGARGHYRAERMTWSALKAAARAARAGQDRV
jgi:hypothetical protein